MLESASGRRERSVLSNGVRRICPQHEGGLLEPPTLLGLGAIKGGGGGLGVSGPCSCGLLLAAWRAMAIAGMPLSTTLPFVLRMHSAALSR